MTKIKFFSDNLNATKSSAMDRWIIIAVSFLFFFSVEAATPKFLTLPLKTNPKVVNGWFYSHPPNAVGEIHRGIDYEAVYNQEIIAAADGIAMTSAQYNNGMGYGKFVLIRHDETNSEGLHYFTLYAHINRATVGIKSYTDQFNTSYSSWTKVKRGQVIAYVGREDSGWDHLHFEVHVGGYAQNKTDPYDLYKPTTETTNSADYYPPYGKLYTSGGSNDLWITTNPIFIDIQDSRAWFYDYVYCLSGLGLVSAYSDGSFKPGNPVSRAEFIQMVVDALELVLGHELLGYCPANPPWNLDPNQWYYDYLMKAYILQNHHIYPAESVAFWNPDSTPDWNGYITREEAAHVVRNALELPYPGGQSMNQFTDVTLINTFYFWIHSIWEAGILHGYSDGTFRPYKILNRAEAAKIIRNILKYREYFDENAGQIPECCRNN